VSGTSTAPRVRPVVVLLGLLSLALNLRAALAGYPPPLETVRGELGVSAGAGGLVQASVVLMMAAGSFAGSPIGTRFGRERALGAAVGLVAVGSLTRGVAALAPLIGGSLLVGFGIGVGGVLLTGVVKEHLASRAGAATGAYVVSMMVGATVSSAVAVPLAVALGGWSRSLAVWAVPALLTAVAWTGVARRIPRPNRIAPRPPLPWRDDFARLAASHQAAAALMGFGWLTWLSPYYESQGWSPQRAGLLLAAWSVAQIPAALLAPALAERRRWMLWSGMTLTCSVTGTLGALVVPVPPLVGPWPWAVLLGIGSGAGFSLGLTMIAWRTPDGAASVATSGLGRV
jgi:MFS transporter, CP family, cyanate transporter